MKASLVAAVIALAIILVAACQNESAPPLPPGGSPTAVPGATDTPTPGPSPTPTATATPLPTPVIQTASIQVPAGQISKIDINSPWNNATVRGLLQSDTPITLRALDPAGNATSHWDNVTYQNFEFTITQDGTYQLSLDNTGKDTASKSTVTYNVSVTYASIRHVPTSTPVPTLTPSTTPKPTAGTPTPTPTGTLTPTPLPTPMTRTADFQVDATKTYSVPLSAPWPNGMVRGLVQTDLPVNVRIMLPSGAAVGRWDDVTYLNFEFQVTSPGLAQLLVDNLHNTVTVHGAVAYNTNPPQ